MFVNNSSRIGGVGARGATARASSAGGVFQPVMTQEAPRIVANSAPLAAASLEALLALQAVEDPILKKKKAMRRGHSMLDTLEAMKADLLAGRVSEGRLNQLMALVGQAREQSVPGLDALLDDIELRARVELAKLGQFPAF